MQLIDILLKDKGRVTVAWPRRLFFQMSHIWSHSLFCPERTCVSEALLSEMIRHEPDNGPPGCFDTI